MKLVPYMRSVLGEVVVTPNAEFKQTSAINQPRRSCKKIRMQNSGTEAGEITRADVTKKFTEEKNPQLTQRPCKRLWWSNERYLFQLLLKGVDSQLKRLLLPWFTCQASPQDNSSSNKQEGQPSRTNSFCFCRDSYQPCTVYYHVKKPPRATSFISKACTGHGCESNNLGF